MNSTKFILLTGWVVLQGLVSSAQTADLKLNYTEPSKKWTDALPIGNGKLGAMIYGGVERDQVQFNEKTLWTGAPRPYYRTGAYKYLPEIRQLLFDGKQKEAQALAEEHFMGRRINEDGYDSLLKAWTQKMVDYKEPAAPFFNTSKWKTIMQPVALGWENEGYDGLDGAIWMRTSFTLPEKWYGKDLWLDLGRIRDMDVTYVNGTLVGKTEDTRAMRMYRVKANLLKRGENTIAVQVLNFYDKGGFVGAKDKRPSMMVYPAGDSVNGIVLPKQWKYWVQNDEPPYYPRYEAAYQPFGDLWLNVKNSENATDYHRELDLQNAVSAISYKANGVQYRRTYFASVEKNAVVIHLSADKEKAITVNAVLTTLQTLHAIKKIDDKTIALRLRVNAGVLNGVSYLHVDNKGGSVTITDSSIDVQNADEVSFYLTAATNYINYKDTTGKPEESCKAVLQNVKKAAYEDVLQKHSSDYQKVFNRFSIQLGTASHAEMTTDQRLWKFTNESDPALIALYVQYARYLMIASSAPGSQAANLQGVWNERMLPPWDSKYTTNVNLEMNYWPVDQLNLSEYSGPFFSLLDDVAEAGRMTAKEHYNAPGWVLHHNTDLWRGTAPINAANHGIWVTGAAWLCHHIWDHYEYTQDKAFLKKHYPEMKSAADFFNTFLIKDPKTGFLISTPSNSPEHGGLVAGPTMDHQIIRDLYKNCIAASKVLGEDADLRNTWQSQYDKIAPNEIGKYGQLKEWMPDVDDTSDKHRHVSHAWGVYPGTDITWDKDAKMMKAAEQSLLYRGDDATGWGLAWRVNLWARFKQGNHALKVMDNLLAVADYAENHERGGTYRNMFDAHPPFQIDGNFGGAAGVGEMLVQSHEGYIDILPALPDALATGAVKGLKVRGGYELNITWKDGKLQTLEVTALADNNDCFVKYGTIERHFTTEKGKTYRLDGQLNKI